MDPSFTGGQVELQSGPATLEIHVESSHKAKNESTEGPNDRYHSSEHA